MEENEKPTMPMAVVLWFLAPIISILGHKPQKQVVNCPVIETLQAFSARGLPPDMLTEEEAGRMECHLRFCKICRETLECLTNEEVFTTAMNARVDIPVAICQHLQICEDCQARVSAVEPRGLLDNPETGELTIRPLER